MTSTRHDIPRLAGRWARRATAWTLCLATLGLATAAAFRSVEAWARPAFGAQVKACDHRVRVGGFQWPVELSDGLVVRQEFDVGRDGLAGLRLQTVTWRHVPDAHACTWSLLEIAADGRARKVVRSGTFDAAATTDWGFIDLAFAPIPDSFAGRYALRIVAAAGRPERPAGLPLFTAVGQPATLNVRRKQEGATPPPIPPAACLNLEFVFDDRAT